MDTGELTNLHPLVAETLERWQVVHTVFHCDPQFADTAVFCEKYDYPLVQAANAIIVAAKGDPVRFACCMVLAVTKLDVNKKVRSLMEGKKVSFASGEQTVALTGMQIGGVTPFGLPEIPLFIDSAVMTQAEVVAGGGNRSTKVLLDPAQLLKLPGAQVVEGLAVPR